MPVGNGDADLVQDFRKRLDQIVSRFRGHDVEQQDDPALLSAIGPIAVSGAKNRLELAPAGALYFENRVQNQLGGKPPRLQLVEDAVDEKWHVVVDDLDERERLPARSRCELDRLPANAVFAVGLGAGESEARLSKLRESLGSVLIKPVGLSAEQEAAVKLEIVRRLEVWLNPSEQSAFGSRRFKCHFDS